MTSQRTVIFLVFLVLHFIKGISSYDSGSNCSSPENCRAGEVCRGTCYTRSLRKHYCAGQCISANRTEVCADEYTNCTPWLRLCSNSVVAKVCKESCGFCGSGVQEPCRGFLCDGTCVPLTYLCDGIRDCRDGNDEANCNYFADMWFNSKRKRRCGIRASITSSSVVNVNYSRSKKTLNLRRGHARRRPKRLVNGKYAAAYSWPWNGILLSDNLPELETKKRTFCGVTLIHPEWAITAAHCVLSEGSVHSPNFQMIFGKHFTAWTGAEKLTNQVRNASKILFFRDYEETDIYNDVALLKLNESVVLNDFVNIVCLPLSFDVQQFHKTGGVATGWGFDENGNMAKRLKQTLVKPMDRGRCTNQIFDLPDAQPNYFSLGPSLLCTEIDRDNGFGVICDGDSGGPMVVRRKTGSYALLGVASFGTDRNCSKVGEAAVYTSVYYYLPWIRHFVDVTYV